MDDSMPNTITCVITKQKLGDHEYTVLYDEAGNKYLMLEKFERINPSPKFDGTVDIDVSSLSNPLMHPKP